MNFLGLLCLSYLSNKTLGLERTAMGLKSLGLRLPAMRISLTAAEGALRVERAMRKLPLGIECLEQAMVTWYVLNRHGHPAELAIGMKLSPLAGHAWVRCGDETFVWMPGIEDFTVVARYGTWRQPT
jgi:hypothetical protein